MLVLAFVSVLLRLVSKAFNEEEYGLDDILIGLALLWYTISESLILRGRRLRLILYDVVNFMYLGLMGTQRSMLEDMRLMATHPSTPRTWS